MHSVLYLILNPTAVAMNSGVDAYNALGRIQEVFEAESLLDGQLEDAELDNSLELDDASFAWDAPPPESEGGRGKGKGKSRKGKKKPEIHRDAAVTPVSGSPGTPTSKEPEKAEEVFKIRKTNLAIPKGQVVAIVGPVGSGKSSLLQGLIGEMRKESGSVKFCGSVSYCPQDAWIQVRPLTPCSVMPHLCKWIAECHHPREHLLRSAFQFR